MMFALSSRGGLGELLERGVDGGLVALGAPLLERLDPLALDLGVGGEDAAVLAGGQRRVLGLGELVLPDDHDARRARSWRSARGGTRPAGPSCRGRPRRRRRCSATAFISALAPSTSSSTRPSITFEPSKMSGYSSRSVSLARICWIRRLHCWSQGRGRPSASFQAGSWIARARASRPEGHGERLEHDPGHVVLGLGLGQPERVDLDAVAQAQELRLGRRRSGCGRSTPTSRPWRAAWRAPR